MTTAYACLLTVLCLLLGAPAFATVIYDNGDPNGGYGVAILSELDGINQVGDNFSLASDAVLNRVDWWGIGDENDFSVRIFEITGGTPAATPIASFNPGPLTGTPQLFPGGDIWFYSVTLPALALSSGDYLLSIVERGTGSNWFWAASCEDACLGTRFGRAGEGDAWSTANFDMAFRLLSVPEPGTALLIVTGLAFLVTRRQ